MNKEKLTELVYINLGRASMCWSEIPKGVFDSTTAAELGKEIMDAIEEYTNKKPSYYTSRNITVEDIHQIHREMLENERNEEMERKYIAAIDQIIANRDYTGQDDDNNPTFRYKGIYYTLDKDFKKILEEKIERPPHWWWSNLG